MSNLLGISNELLHNVLRYVEPRDLPALRKTCSTLNSYINNNDLLFKDVYIETLGCPSEPQHRNWESEIQNVVAMLKLLECDDLQKKRDDLELVASTIATLMNTTKCMDNVQLLGQHFEAEKNIDAFLASSSLFQHAGTISQKPAATEQLRQRSAQLHCLYGVPIDSPESTSYLRDDPDKERTSFRILFPSRSSSTVDPDGPVTRSQTINIPTNTYARSKVYDLRQYTDKSFWGPFKDDGSQDVDWEKAEAIMVVLGYNLRMFRDRARFEVDPVWDIPWSGAQPNSFVTRPNDCEAHSAEHGSKKELRASSTLDEQDPYGISGMWMRVVCFLDYHDLYAFNFARPPPSDGQPREPIDTREAIRMIKLKLEVTKIEPPGEDDGKDYPVVTFTGTSWSLHNSWDPNANSAIRGVVRQTPEGEIRWTTWSIFHGEERWRSEGIQIGGARSGRGVLGNWFDKDFDVHGPAGPTAFWKIKDEYDEDDRSETPLNFLDMAFVGVEDSESDDSD